jgi:hypothetical protein
VRIAENGRKIDYRSSIATDKENKSFALSSSTYSALSIVAKKGQYLKICDVQVSLAFRRRYFLGNSETTNAETSDQDFFLG